MTSNSEATKTETTDMSASPADRLVMCLNELKSTGHLCTEKIVIDVSYTINGCNGPKEKPIASVFPDDKYIQFHDEFTHIGIDVPGLGQLSKSWSSNHT